MGNEIEERKATPPQPSPKGREEEKERFNTVIATYTAQWAFPKNYTTQQITEFFKNNVPKSLVLDDWDFQED